MDSPGVLCVARRTLVPLALVAAGSLVAVTSSRTQPAPTCQFLFYNTTEMDVVGVHVAVSPEGQRNSWSENVLQGFVPAGVGPVLLPYPHPYFVLDVRVVYRNGYIDYRWNFDICAGAYVTQGLQQVPAPGPPPRVAPRPPAPSLPPVTDTSPAPGCAAKGEGLKCQ